MPWLTHVSHQTFPPRLCAQYVDKNHADSVPNFKWAIAGRSLGKLKSVLAEMKASNKPDVVIVDCDQYDTVHSYASLYPNSYWHAAFFMPLSSWKPALMASSHFAHTQR